MNINLRDLFEYIIALVNEFSKRFQLSDRDAFNYIANYNGISFIEQNYGIIHTLSFEEAVDSIANFCRRSGGNL